MKNKIDGNIEIGLSTKLDEVKDLMTLFTRAAMTLAYTYMHNIDDDEIIYCDKVEENILGIHFTKKGRDVHYNVTKFSQDEFEENGFQLGINIVK